MADVDNLDTLSNAELRAQMLAQGLPNIPITDSSRKVLVKRLRASLGGNAASPAVTASPKKAAARRETLQPAVAPAAAAAAPPQVDKPDGASASSKSRRTIANTPSDIKEAERRRQAVIKSETVAPQPRVPPAIVQAAQPVAVAVAAPKAAPIQPRRISNTERREQPAERVARKPETIAEEPTGPKQRHNENTLMVNSLIILESDEEEDEQLAQAARNAEAQYRHNKKTEKPKLSATTTSTHEYVNKPLYPTLEPTLEQQRFKQTYEHGTSASQPRTALASNYAYATTGRYSSYITSPAASYTAASTKAAAPTLGASSYRRSPPRTFSNEFSDDTADEDATQGVKFESDFARNLARLRAERIGDRSSPFRRTISGGGLSASGSGSGSITGARRSLRPEQASPMVSLTRWCQSLDRKYNLKSKLFILLVVLLLYSVYRFFY